MRNQPPRLWIPLALLTVLTAAGCAADATCDPGQELRGGYCFPVTADAGPRPDSTPPGDAGGDTCEPDAGPDTIGRPCTDNIDHSECDCSAPYCAINPGMTQGTCTRTDCIEYPERCPVGYACMDLSIFDPALPSICVPE